MRFVTSGRCRFLLLNRLKTSSAGSIVKPPCLNPRDRRRSSEEYWLSFRPRLRCVTLPSGLIRSCGVWAIALKRELPNASTPQNATLTTHESDCGCAERYE